MEKTTKDIRSFRTAYINMNIVPLVVLTLSLFNRVNSTCCEGMTINQAGLNLVEQSEGCVQHVYNDAAGNPTVCYGHLVEPGESFPGTVSMQECQNLLKEDLAGAEGCIKDNVDVPLTDNQFSALTDFTYNLGCGTLKSSTLLRDLNGGDYSAVPQQMGRFVYAGGNILPGLVTRRQREAELWETPAEPKNPGVPAEPKNPGASAEPNNPGVPAEPKNPGVPAEPNNPGASAEPNNPGASAEPNNPGAPTDESSGEQSAEDINGRPSVSIPSYAIVLIVLTAVAVMSGVGLSIHTYIRLKSQRQASLNYHLMQDSH
jgi:lysozyme